MTELQSKTIARLAFTGDIYLKEGHSIKLSEAISNSLDSCDIRSCNIESPIMCSEKATEKAGPCLQQTTTVIEKIERNGFNLANLANNHIMDYGWKAAEATQNALHIPTIGVGKNFNEATKPYIATIGQMKVGFLSFGECEFGAITEYNDSGFAWINHPKTDEIISLTKKECDILIVQVHAGIELINLPLPEWRIRYKELIDHGADAIIATHPHVPQGWEIYKGHPIFYSLGNFYFDNNHNHPMWNKGIIAFLNIHDDYSITCDVKGIQRKDMTIDEWKGDEYEQYISSLCQILHSGEYEKVMNETAIKLWNNIYRRHYENAINGVSHANVIHLIKFIKRLFTRKALNIPMLLHNCRIESHHWIVKRALNQLYKEKINGNIQN